MKLISKSNLVIHIYLCLVSYHEMISCPHGFRSDYKIANQNASAITILLKLIGKIPTDYRKFSYKTLREVSLLNENVL